MSLVQRVFTPGCGCGDGHTLTPTLTTHTHTHTRAHTNTRSGQAQQRLAAVQEVELLNKHKIFNFPKWEAGVGCVPKRGNKVCACTGLCDLVRGSIQPDVNGHIFLIRVTRSLVQFSRLSKFLSFLLKSYFCWSPYLFIAVFHQQFCSEIWESADSARQRSIKSPKGKQQEQWPSSFIHTN